MNSNYYEILNEVLVKCKKDNYIGWDKFDGTLAPIAQKVNNKFFNFFIQQIVKESPINLRKLLKIPKTLNIKGLALFILSYSNLFKIYKNDEFLEEALHLTDLLIGLKSKDFEEACWGHNFTWQTIDTKILSDQPNVTNTYFSALAIYNVYEITKESKYFEIISSIYNFMTKNLYILLDKDGMLAYSYFTIPQKYIVFNIQGMIASFYLLYYKLTNNSEAIFLAEKLYNFLKKSMNLDHTWNYYTGNKFNRIDSYHSAYVIDSFFDLYNFSKKLEDLEFYLKCLDVYKEKFWGANGEPYWSLKFKFPYDIHSVANGVITFSKASNIDKRYLEYAQKILNWVIKYMYRPKEKDFIYRIYGPFKYNYSLMRWGNAWMCYAISEYLKYEEKS